MNEAKSLVHMSVSAMIAALFVGLAVGLITLGYFIWSMFSSQDLASRRLRDYATYAAYDNTVIRGQDAVSLIATTEGDPFVVVFIGDYENETDYNSTLKLQSFYHNSVTQYATLNYNDNYYKCSNASADYCFRKLINEDDHSADKPVIPEGHSLEGNNNFSDGNVTYSDLQSTFVARTSYYTVKADGTKDPVLGYSSFYSVLIYDGNSSTDVVGILLVELPAKEDV